MLRGEPERIPLAGPGGSIAWSREDQLLLLVLNPLDPSTSTLVCLDMAGQQLWAIELSVDYQRPLRAAADGAVWLGMPDRLCEYGPGGECRRTVALPTEQGE